MTASLGRTSAVFRRGKRNTANLRALRTCRARRRGQTMGVMNPFRWRRAGIPTDLFFFFSYYPSRRCSYSCSLEAPMT